MDNIIIKKLYKGKVEVKFYGPTEDKPNRHMYYVAGKRKTGVTTFLGIVDKSNALVSWSLEEAAKHLILHLEQKKAVDEEQIVKAVFAHKEIKERAADLGKTAHAWCEKYILADMGKGESPEMPEEKEVVTAVNGFMDWVKEHKIKFVSTEKLVYSKKYDYIGTMDIEAIIKGRRYLIDLKTSNGLYNTVRMQTAAYLKADQEEGGMHYQGRWAVRLAKETEEEYLAKIELKNKIKRILGKKETEAKKYVPFEARYLDDDKDALEYDFKTFLATKNLFLWNKATDFYYADKKR